MEISDFIGLVNEDKLTWKKQASEGSLVTYLGVYSLRSNEAVWDVEKLCHMDFVLITI
jgi:hypothetical protein